MQRKHSLEGLRVRCGRFFGVVKHGRCSECGCLVAVYTPLQECKDVSPASDLCDDNPLDGELL
jgi:hypothetical protein